MNKWGFLKAFTNVLSGSENQHADEWVTASNETYHGQTVRPLHVNVIDSVSHAHLQVHNGNVWSVGQVYTGLADSLTAGFLIEVGADPLHAAFAVEGGGDFLGYFYEGATANALGTTVTASSNNRTKATATSATFFSNPTLATAGALLASVFVSGGTKNQAIGGSGGGAVREGTEWILSANTNYYIELLNQAATTKSFSISMTYYQQNSG